MKTNTNAQSTNTVSATTVLNSLTPEVRDAVTSFIRNEYQSEIFSSLTSSLGITSTKNGPAKKGAVKKGSGNKGTGKKNNSNVTVKKEAPTKRGPKVKNDEEKPTKRVRTSDGRTASQVIRDYDASNPGAAAKTVVEYCDTLGLKIKPALVYNIRQGVKKSSEPNNTEVIEASSNYEAVEDVVEDECSDIDN